jgi:hypothetical protein
LIDPPFLFTAGSLIALVSRRQIVARKPNLFGLSAWVTAGFAVFYWISVTWFVVNSPDWMLSYAIPATQLPMGSVHGLFGLLLLAAGFLGHTFTAAALQRGKRSLAMLILMMGALAFGVLWVWSIDRYMAVGTHAEFWSGRAVPLQGSSIIGVMNLVGALHGITGIGTLAWLYSTGRQLKAR